MKTAYTLKHAGEPWLGAIPARWRLTRLKYLVGLVNGAAFGPEDWDDEGTPIIRIENLNGGQDFNFTRKHVSERCRVSPGALLFGWSGNRGTSFGPFLWDRPGEYLLNQHIFRVMDFEVNKKWLYWTLRAVTLDIESRTQGIIGMVHVTRPELGMTTIPVPPDGEQRAIAAFLDRKTAAMDALMGKKERLIELLQEKRQALITQAVTKGLDPNVPMKDSGIPSIPTVPYHWTVVRNKVLLREVNERVGPDASDDLLTVSHLTGVGRRSDRQNVTMFMAESTEGYKRCSPGDLAINTMWAWMGALGVAPIGGIVSPSYNVYRFKAWQETRFFDLLFRTPLYVAEIGSRSEGVWTSRLRLYPEAFLGLLTAVPPPEEQLKILAFIDQSLEREHRIESRLREAHDLLREYRQALISAAVTGKIDVASEEVA